MWLVCFGLFAVSLAVPLGPSPWGRSRLENYQVQLIEYGGSPQQKQSICFSSPFLGQICVPTGLRFFLPVPSFGAVRDRCLTVPVIRTHAVRVCPPSGFLPSKRENPGKSLKEPIKEVKAETEKKRLRDNANVELNGGEVGFVKKERADGTGEGEVGATNLENEINRGTEESPAQDLTDEYPDITSNLV